MFDSEGFPVSSIPSNQAYVLFFLADFFFSLLFTWKNKYNYAVFLGMLVL